MCILTYTRLVFSMYSNTSISNREMKAVAELLAVKG